MSEVSEVQPVSQSIFAKERERLFTRYRVRLQIRDRIVGGVPFNPEMMAGWIKASMGIDKKQEILNVMREKIAELGQEDVPADISQEDLFALAEKVSKQIGSNWSVGFMRGEKGLYLESRCLKSHLRECVNILFAGERFGKTKKGAKSFFNERVFVEPSKIWFRDEAGNGMDQPSGLWSFVGHISDKLGQRSTLTLYEYCERPILEFEVIALGDCIEPEQWAPIWTLGEEIGLGALRSQAQGMYDCLQFERVKV